MRFASNNQVKLLRKLSQRKHREKEKLFIVEGERSVSQILENRTLKVEALFIEAGKSDSYQFPQTPCYLLNEEVMAAVSDTENPQGVIALCAMPEEASVESLKNETGIIIAVDALQDPGNLGTIIRTAAWFGVKALLHGKGSVDIFNPKVVRSTAGATGILPFLSGRLKELLSDLESAGWQVLLLDGGDASLPIGQLSARTKTILVTGNEANGITPELFTPNRQPVLIPARGIEKGVESLNAAIATGIAIWSVNN